MAHEPILIATDLGETAAAVVEAGLAFAELLGGHPLLLHVDTHGHLFGEAFHAVDGEDLRRMKAAYGGQALSSMRRLVQGAGRDSHAVETVCREGKPHEVLLAAAAERAVAAVVLGKHVRAGVERLLLGRTAVRVAREAMCPVLTADVRRKWRGIARVLYAADLKDRHREAERWAARLAGAAGAHLTVLHVTELGGQMAAPYALPPSVHEGIKTALEERLEGLKQDLVAQAAAHGTGASGARARLFVAHDAAAAIAEVAREEDSHLVVLGTHGRRGLTRALLGSVAEGALQRAATHVLTVREAAG
jgi:nucleotide-binding universal stress UspA family protein